MTPPHSRERADAPLELLYPTADIDLDAIAAQFDARAYVDRALRERGIRP